MNDEVNFSEEQSFKSPTISERRATPKMVTFLMKIGIAKNEKVAGYILLVLSIIILIIAVVIFINTYSKPNTVNYNDLSEVQKQSLPDSIRRSIE